MPITLASQFTSSIERPHGNVADQLLWLIELQVAKAYRSGATIVPSVVARFCSDSQAIKWPIGTPNFLQEWYPINFTFNAIEQDQEGNLPQLDLSIDNTTRALMRVLHSGDGMEGNYCHIYLVPRSTLSIASPNHVFQVWKLDVAATFATDEAITFRLEKTNFFQKMVPQDRFHAERCRWSFGSPECGYVINNIAAYTTCPKTVAACKLRGQDHAARGLPVLHPRRFGGFPGIPTQR